MYFPETIRGRIHYNLTQSPRPLTAAELAARVHTTPAQARLALNRLEADDTVQRRPAPGGRYAWTATDTPAGRSGRPQPGR